MYEWFSWISIKSSARIYSFNKVIYSNDIYDVFTDYHLYDDKFCKNNHYILIFKIRAQQSIPNQILVGIALVLTIFIMSPVVDKINKEAIQPYREEKITFQEGIEKAQIPMKEFGQAEQVADLTVFLAGQDYLTGQVVAIDGGLSM